MAGRTNGLFLGLLWRHTLGDLEIPLLSAIRDVSTICAYTIQIPHFLPEFGNSNRNYQTRVYSSSYALMLVELEYTTHEHRESKGIHYRFQMYSALL